jgi:FkbM family methyltransferase
MSKLANFVDGFRDLLKFDNRMQLVVNRLLFRKQSLVVYRRGELEVLIDHDGGDQCGTRDCLLSDMYSRYFHLLPRTRPINVMDLGANGGGLPLCLVAHGFSLGSLACVEMNPATFTRLHFNISRNIRAQGSHLINAAVYHSDGSLSLVLGKGGTNDSIHGENFTKGADRQVVRARSFDSIAEECFPGALIDLCKIDIEGAEFEVILSSAASRLRSVRLLLIEIHPHPRHETASLLSALEGMGFEELSREQEAGGRCSIHLLKNRAVALSGSQTEEAETCAGPR